MVNLFFEGGIFMVILTILLVIIIAMAVYQFVQVSKNDTQSSTLRNSLRKIKSVGLFTLIVGIFGQLLSLYQAFSFIEEAGSASPAILAGGLKVSMIPTLYGMVIFLFSYLVWMGLDYNMKKN